MQNAPRRYHGLCFSVVDSAFDVTDAINNYLDGFLISIVHRNGNWNNLVKTGLDQKQTLNDFEAKLTSEPKSLRKINKKNNT